MFLQTICADLRRSPQIQWTLFSVVANMSLTLAVWIGVYRMKVNEELSQLYFLDDSFNRTTGNATLDGLINGFGTICVLGCVSFMMLAFVLYDFRRIVKAWLTFSCILILFGVSGQTMYDLCLRVFDQNDDNQFLATVFFSVIPTLIYGSIGIYAFLADGSIFLHQFFVVANCSLISVFYLRAFPKHTTWFVLWTVLFGILKFLMFAAEERREVGGADEELNEERKMRKDVKQLIQMYTKKDAQDDEFLQKIRQRRTAINPDSGLTGHSPLVDTEPSPIQLKDRDSDEEKSDDEISSVSSSSSSSSDSSESIPSPSDVSTAEECAPEDWNQMVHSSPGYEPLTAADALNDGETVRLGFGDFVFYSLLIGQAATGGCPVAVAFAAIGILFGLVATLTVLSSEESTTPALPLPVICGTLFYFVSKMVMDHICI